MNPISGFHKLVYWPICRAYARYLGDRPADAFFRLLCSLQFREVYGFWPDFVHPGRFSEKLWNRMLHERDPVFTLISDKLRVRDYVVEKVGNNYLIPVLWRGENAEGIPFDELPLEFVIKTNHGCGYNIIVKDKTKIDRVEIRLNVKRWLTENFCQDKYLGIEWGYKNIKPSIYVEAFLNDGGKVPVDYKYYCFFGRVEILTLHFNRHEGHATKAFDRNFVPCSYRSEFKQYGGPWQRPLNFEEMVRLAEALAKDFDFMRVDLYNLNGRIFFSELTPYPAGVSSFRALDIVSLDHILGEKWKGRQAVMPSGDPIQRGS